MADKPKEFMVEDAQIIFRNFEGAEGMYNRDGDRNFAVILDEDSAQQMEADGWNVKRLKPREDDEEPEAKPYIQVTVSYKHRPPKVILLTSTSRTVLNEESIDVLDYSDIAVADLICRGYEWSVNDKTGVKAYLKSLYVTIDEDDLDRKYAVIDEPLGDD